MSNLLGFYVCHHPTCRKSFKRKYDWSRHINTHLDKQFVCNHCSKKFTRPSGLSAHLQICKLANNNVFVADPDDATILDVRPVIPVNLNMAKTSEMPPKKGMDTHGWIATDSTSSVQKAIKILSKYDHGFQPQPLSRPQADKKVARPEVSVSKPQPLSSLSAEGTQNEDTTPTVFTRTPSLPITHASNSKPVKRVSFEDTHTLVPPVPKPREIGFKKCTAQKRQSPHHPGNTAGFTPKKPKVWEWSKPELLDAEQRTPQAPQRTLLRELVDTPVTIPLECVTEVPDPRPVPESAIGKDNTKVPPLLKIPEPQEYESGLFDTDIEDEDALLKKLLDTPERVISPLISPMFGTPNSSPDSPKPRPSVPLEKANKVNTTPPDMMDYIGPVSPDSHTSEPPSHTSEVETAPDICHSTNLLIIEIISELSIINERSMSTNMGQHKKALGKILKKLKKITTSM